MPNPTLDGFVFTPNPPVSGKPFTLRVLGSDLDVGVALSYDITVTDQEGNVATGKAIALSDKLSFTATPADATSPELSPVPGDPALFTGIAP